MKSSLLLSSLVPTLGLAAEVNNQIPPAVAPSPSVPNTTPPAPLPEVQIASLREHGFAIPFEARQLHPADMTVTVAAEDPLPTTAPAQWPEPARGNIGLRALVASPGMTKSLRARSEGTLGQTPWIGMAIGLTCTALAAVMLG
ncbi:hypothetical protein N8T08_011196 [Aspergillus melleus]|uniref:Uncharacterized protein n=1 Tax=Aspergillus melleus TaxID=138277 RepID=A0ACC3AQ37_9EURO|nr:hypothetical protein N8T08_011196 [Aspergillus melleus]